MTPLKTLQRIALFLLLALPLFAWSKEIPKPMSPPRLVNDFAQLLSGYELQSLEDKLLKYSDTTSTEIAVVIIESLEGDEINRYAAELGQVWGVGQRGNDNGCVILLSVSDKTVSIQNGYGLEAYLTDYQSWLIIENDMFPHFKNGDYYSGLNAGSTAIFETLAGTYEGKGNRNTKFNPRSLIFVLIIFFVLVSIFKNRKGGPGNRGGGGGGWMFFPLGGGFGSSNTFGGGGFGGSGGGFGGFGGGGFGGGGASGGW